ncbi:integrase core domain-containing protein [Botrimarina hoheduenensis]|uniref:Integrase core domain protein n=1 Tax=Botrimarina hoheduenensis TaxID=2528000 RepID=A0A5C5WFV3_9BACT|nr:integrase core domain-containing protein [Botrimarina hoheduenensis]TWT48975.1 Integrase core domain protein [Botrimarina hoheduenensis]
MPLWFSPLFFLFARSNDEQLRQQILFLKAELELTRARVPLSRIFLTDDERQRLLELGDGIGSDALKLVSIVHPRTYRRWLERRSQGKPPTKKMGRKGTSETIRQIVVRLAKQNQWGYGRIVGELRKLRIHCVGRTTVRTILKEEGIHPGPKRGPGTWDEFIKIHAETLWQCDFFSKMVMTSTGLRQAYVLAFLHVNSRRMICSPATLKADDTWVTAQAESMLEQARGRELPVRYLIRDLDLKYSKRFDQAFSDAGVSVEPTAPRAPNQIAFIERWIGSIRGECLIRFIIFGLGHLDHVVTSYLDYYHQARPHQRKKNKPLLGVWPEVDDPPNSGEELVCREWLGGVLKHYERTAA